jgi:hypothetical protein
MPRGLDADYVDAGTNHGWVRRPIPVAKALTVRQVEVSTDGGANWRQARTHGPGRPGGWLRWEFPWHPDGTGPHTLLARATDTTGTTQNTARYNTLGYLFDAVVRPPVTVS